MLLNVGYEQVALNVATPLCASQNAGVLFAISVGSILLAYVALWFAVRNLRKTKPIKHPAATPEPAGRVATP